MVFLFLSTSWYLITQVLITNFKVQNNQHIDLYNVMSIRLYNFSSIYFVYSTEIALVNKFGEDTESSYEVVANKPFLFFIQDEPTRQLLFTGRVSNPELVDGAYKLQ